MKINERLDLKNIQFNSDETTVTEDRDKYLGGSDIGKIHGKRGLYNTWRRKRSNYKFEGSEITELGHYMEELGRDIINDKLKKKFEPACLVDEEDLTRANTDGLYLDVKNLLNDDNGTVILELKNNTPSTSYINLNSYIKQMHFYMYKFNATYGYLGETLRRKDENGNFIKTLDEEHVSLTKIPRNEKIIDEVLENIKDFKFLQDHPETTFNDFVGNDKNKIKQYEERVNEFSNKLIERKRLEFKKDKLTKLIKEILDEKPYSNSDYTVKFSTTTRKPSFSKEKFYENYKKFYMFLKFNYELNNPIYKDKKIAKFELTEKGYKDNEEFEKFVDEEMNNLLATGLDKIIELLQETKQELKEYDYLKEEETLLKQELLIDFPNGVDFENLIFSTITERNDFLENIEKDNYTQAFSEPKTSSVMRITKTKK